MKEEYGSGFDGTPEQALKYAQDTPGQELEVKRLLKIIGKNKMPRTPLQIIKAAIREENDIPKSRLRKFSPGDKINKTDKEPVRRDPIGDKIKELGLDSKRKRGPSVPPSPERNPVRLQYKDMKKPFYHQIGEYA